jgi:hypothetical protein
MATLVAPSQALFVPLNRGQPAGLLLGLGRVYQSDPVRHFFYKWA